MHGFGLVTGSIISHPWAAGLVSDTQVIVTYFRASHFWRHALEKAAKGLGITMSLKTSVATRFTSVYECLESVRLLEAAFRAVIIQDGAIAIITNKRVTELLSNRRFWDNLADLCKLLEPFTKATMAVQAQATTAADVLRYWCMLAKVIKLETSHLDRGMFLHYII